MAKKFKWHPEFEETVGDPITTEVRERLMKIRYSDLDLIGFSGVFMENLGIDPAQYDDDTVYAAAKKAYADLTEMIISGDYDKIIEEDYPVTNG